MDAGIAKHAAGPRHSILDLAPLELECLSALWPMGEGTVRDIHRQLSVARPRAYTTVLTIMDRLAQKGIVARRKVGRAFRYQANLSAEEARLKAVEKIVAGFFAGSADALAAHLAGHGISVEKTIPPAAEIVDVRSGVAVKSRQQNLDQTLL
jgi:BlaI family transcriptional regulator, penicillinase repressor